MMLNKTALLIVAAGKGLRARSEIPKQYVKISGKSILKRTVENLTLLHNFDIVQIVINEDDKELFFKEKIETTKNLSVCFGGKERTNSVFKGLQSLKRYNPKYVLIHDAVRPFTSKKIIDDILNELKKFDAIMPVLPIVDAMWFKKKNLLTPQKQRENFLRAQTPQGFKFKKILKAHEENSKNFNDDVELALNSGLSIGTIEGSEDNFKVTNKEDFLKTERYLNC